MSVFRFKKFSVVNSRSAMKVNTDGVLLGAAMTLNGREKYLLDVGTGTGTIALMAAQRLSDMAKCLQEISIEAIDIDGISIEEASDNFRNSPWADMLSARHCPLNDFMGGTYDMIFSNPPYYDCSLPAPDSRRNTARHTEGLSYRELVQFASSHLSSEGRLALILPSATETDLLRYARMHGLFLSRVVRVKTVPHKPAGRIITEFIPMRCSEVVEEEVIIQDKGKYTDRYLSLTSDFYLFA